MTMTREEYLAFIFGEHIKLLKKEHNNAEPGTTVVFNGFYGCARYTRQSDGKWERTVK